MKLQHLFEYNHTRENPRLKAWLGDSKTVDNDGNPVLLFHGTAYDFEAFDRPMIWATEDPKLASIYAEQRPHWDGFVKVEGSNVIPVFMKVEKPFNADELGHTSTVKEFLLAMVTQAKNYGVNIQAFEERLKNTLQMLWHGAKTEESGPIYSTYDFWYEPHSFFGEKATQVLTQLFFDLGFDGIFYSEIGTDGDHPTWGTFYKNHVKSAIGNIGTYSIESDYITESSRRK